MRFAGLRTEMLEDVVFTAKARPIIIPNVVHLHYWRYWIINEQEIVHPETEAVKTNVQELKIQKLSIYWGDDPEQKYQVAMRGHHGKTFPDLERTYLLLLREFLAQSNRQREVHTVSDMKRLILLAKKEIKNLERLVEALDCAGRYP